LDGADLGFAHRIGQDAKADATDLEVYARKAIVSPPKSGIQCR
jgi:hypothetical protein